MGPKWVALFLFFGFLGSSLAARILVLYPVCSRSHKFTTVPLFEELAKRGHQITVFSPFQPTKTIENVHEVVLKGVSDFIESSEMNWFEMEKSGAFQIFETMVHMRTMVKIGYEALMSHPEFRDILEKRSVDLIIFDALFNEFTYAIADHLKVPYIKHDPSSGLPSNLDTMGVYQEYASIPTAFSDISETRMTFFQRLGNMMQSEMFTLFYKMFVRNLMEGMTQKDFPGSRSYAELERETSLFILNSHPTTARPRSLPPNVITLGALHTRPAQPLPQVKS